jgi:hypothetical protein
VQLKLEAREHIDVRTCCVVGRAVVNDTNSGDVEWCGLSVDRPDVADAV